MPVITVAGIDPSLRNTGYCKGKLETETGMVNLTEIGLFQTSKSSNKQIRANSDTLERTQKTMYGLLDAMKGVDLIFAELPSGSQTASGMKSYAISIAHIAVISRNRGLIQVQPNDIKKAVGGRITTTKDEIIRWAYQRFSGLDWPKKKDGTLIKSKVEHIADSIAAIHAGMMTQEYLTISKFFK